MLLHKLGVYRSGRSGSAPHFQREREGERERESASEKERGGVVIISGANLHYGWLRPVCTLKHNNSNFTVYGMIRYNPTTATPNNVMQQMMRKDTMRNWSVLDWNTHILHTSSCYFSQFFTNCAVLKRRQRNRKEYKNVSRRNGMLFHEVAIHHSFSSRSTHTHTTGLFFLGP